jgi:hypothetical protein
MDKEKQITINNLEDARGIVLKQVQIRIARNENRVIHHLDTCWLCVRETMELCPSGVIIQENSKKVIEGLKRMIDEANRGFDVAIKAVREGREGRL